MHDTLADYIKNIDVDTISDDRLQVLQSLIDYIQLRFSSDRPVLLNFVCTHNSRRSQIAQIWAQVAADMYGLEAVCYSGGTEVTAFNTRAVAAMQRAGLSIQRRGEDTNPTYLVQHAYSAQCIICFSKKYDNIYNPTSDFAAVMTCSDADENCPYIPGAATRIKITYDDPKISDDTPEEQTTYDERVLQIATEMFYVMANVEG